MLLQPLFVNLRSPNKDDAEDTMPFSFPEALCNSSHGALWFSCTPARTLVFGLDAKYGERMTDSSTVL